MRQLHTGGDAIFAVVDRLNTGFSVLAAWLFVAAGGMLVFEVVARYIFVAPTVWAAELSLLCLIWGTYLAAAALLRRRQHIAITLLTGRLSTAGRRLSEALSLAIILVLSVTAVWHGADIAGDSLDRGRTTGSMLNLPAWVAEASIPFGFLLIGLQALVELVRLATGRPAPTEGEPKP